MFRTYDHPQGALSVLSFNFSKEQCMLPEDDRMIEICRSVLSVLIQILDYCRLYMCICWCVTQIEVFDLNINQLDALNLE